jgi:hypothetical protein
MVRVKFTSPNCPNPTWNQFLSRASALDWMKKFREQFGDSWILELEYKSEFDLENVRRAKMLMRVKQVNDIIKALGLSSRWEVTTEAEALELVDNVCEGEFQPHTHWLDALDYFERHLVAYSQYCEEVAADYRREYD